MATDSAIDVKIVEMRKAGSYVLTIHDWLREFDNYSMLDEQVVLCHICSVLNDANLAVSRNEVRKVFNKYYHKDWHGDKKSYLNWIYSEFKIKNNTRVYTPQVRKKIAIPQTTDTKTRLNLQENEKNILRQGLGAGGRE